MTRALLNAGAGAWAFEEITHRLSRALWLEPTNTPADLNYLFAWEGPEPPPGRLFIPFAATELAADKRLQAQVFLGAEVPVPETYLLPTPASVRAILQRDPAEKWALKWPTGCGAAGHQLLRAGNLIPEEWPRPYVLQRFIELARPEVYRFYCVAGETFGWNVRRFPPGVSVSPWVAHAREIGRAHV